ncbi:hypothetical protein [Agaribacterium sp. ZY112]|uniref:hypothetical protein n=1 Tax=Agaribacterium sp. ZY112 TaxID=3233574 RepID=UPI0035252C59
MNSEQNQQRLISILMSLGHCTFTVTDVRDQLLTQLEFSNADPAKARRWVAGKFVTFERWGWLEKSTDEIKNRDHFKILPKLHNDIASGEPYEDLASSSPVQEDSNAFQNLSKELEQYRKTIITQMSEIEEYKRVEHAYPELKRLATHRFQAVRDENYRLLGKMKALENLITSAEKNG